VGVWVGGFFVMSAAYYVNFLGAFPKSRMNDFHNFCASAW
jgi:hypothetical protein